MSGHSQLRTVLVAVNVGNTTTSAGIYVDGALVRTARVPSASLRKSWSLFGRAEDDFRGETTAALIGSVVPELTEVAGDIASGEFDAPARFYRRDIDAGLVVAIDFPERIGDDRLLNALAALERFREDGSRDTSRGVVVVDLGTAVTVDAVSGDAEFLGGAILPGARVCVDAMASRTALLPRIDLKGDLRVPGRNTEQAMRAGLLHGLAGAIDRLVEKTWESLGSQTPVLATGGEAALVVPLAQHVHEIEPALTLEGLVRAAEAHAAGSRAGDPGGPAPAGPTEGDGASQDGQ